MKKAKTYNEDYQTTDDAGSGTDDLDKELEDEEEDEEELDLE